jgi:hypothetical protein
MAALDTADADPEPALHSRHASHKNAKINEALAIKKADKGMRMFNRFGPDQSSHSSSKRTIHLRQLRDTTERKPWE